ncbi:MAG TPA: hypothetical protein VHP63_05485 [candidate division Zixibacteria bacterium]|nr:hypothetical protein [candidate division Zixibacteria bacterium]
MKTDAKRTCPIDNDSTLNQLEERKWMWIPVIDGKAVFDNALVQVETYSAHLFQGSSEQLGRTATSTPEIFKSIADSLIESYSGDSENTISPTQNNNANPAKADIKE